MNGRRVYRVNDAPGWITVRQIQAPLTDIKVWMPDPANPQNASVENQLFHPSFLAHVNQASWGYIRTMGLTETNASPVQDWADRRRPRHAFAVGILNTRPPANGFAGNRATGVAYEHLVALSNATQKDLWINVPHLATDDFVQRLARLIRFGSDGTNPYTSPQASPVWPPLAANLPRVRRVLERDLEQRGLVRAGQLGAGPGERGRHQQGALQRAPLQPGLAHLPAGVRAAARASCAWPPSSRRCRGTPASS